LRQQIAKQNSDLARLRGQRDEMNAELTERRSRETEKMRHGEQMEALAASRQDRIGFLASEVRRLKGQLGAEAGSKGYLEFLREAGIDGDYVKDLEARVA
jgi:E3 ubiquitin-protein ligase BRE1